MIDLVRDTWRAVLVVVVMIVLREVLAERPAPSQPVAAAPAPVMPMMPLPGPVPQWQPAPGYGNPYQQPTPAHGNPNPEQRNDRPLRRIGSAVVELGDSLLGAIRR